MIRIFIKALIELGVTFQVAAKVITLVYKRWLKSQKRAPLSIDPN